MSEKNYTNAEAFRERANTIFREKAKIDQESGKSCMVPLIVLLQMEILQ